MSSRVLPHPSIAVNDAYSSVRSLKESLSCVATCKPFFPIQQQHGRPATAPPWWGISGEKEREREIIETIRIFSANEISGLFTVFWGGCSPSKNTFPPNRRRRPPPDLRVIETPSTLSEHSSVVLFNVVLYNTIPHFFYGIQLYYYVVAAFARAPHCCAIYRANNC